MARELDKGIVENFFRRDGRLNRWRYFKRVMVIGVVMMIITMVIFLKDMNALGLLSPTGDIVFKAVTLAMIVPIFCLMVRRLHDIGHDEKLAYLYVAISVSSAILIDNTTPTGLLIPQLALGLAGSVISLYCLFRPGTRGYNKYGADPLA